MKLLQRAKVILRIELSTTSHRERWISAIGSFIAIALLYWVSSIFLAPNQAAMMAFSMGASAVLLFAVPHGPLSQPWPMIGGNILSAIIGVACALWIHPPLLAAALAVSMAILCMHYLRCLHPPGGATALIAVLGGDSVHQLGWQFVLTPITLNVAIMLFVAVGFNYFFAWRRYPMFLAARTMSSTQPSTGAAEEFTLSHADIRYALSSMDSFIDINEADLLRIYQVAITRQQQQRIDPSALEVGRYYSNGRLGEVWSIRRIVDASPVKADKRGMVLYRVAAGHEKRDSGYCSREDFSRWARYEVVKDGDRWQRRDDQHDAAKEAG